MKQKAFTIPELLIFMAIVGIISALMMTIVKPDEKYFSYGYYNSYYVLSTTAYNVLNDAMNLENADTTGSIYDSKDKTFPKTASELCKKFAQNPAAKTSQDQDYGYINTITYNCSSFITSKKPAASQFAKGNETFKATNSMRFFIGANASGTPFSDNVTDSLNGGTYNLEYFLIWVDLNGDRGPNRLDVNKGRKPDIVPFVVTTSGSVVPIGYPITDKAYLTARVIYSDSSGMNDSMPMEFYSARQRVYGKNKGYPTVEPLSVDFSTLGIGSNVSVTLPADVSQDDDCKSVSGTMPSCSIGIEARKAF